MPGDGPLNEEIVEKALTSPASRKILAAVIRQPRSVKEISHQTDLPLASTYRQVRALVEDGLLLVERSALTDNGKVYDLYRSRVRTARIELGDRSVRVTWEPNLDLPDRIVSIWDKLKR